MGLLKRGTHLVEGSDYVGEIRCVKTNVTNPALLVPQLHYLRKRGMFLHMRNRSDKVKTREKQKLNFLKQGKIIIKFKFSFYLNLI